MSIRFPKNMKPLVRKYEDKIARLAQQTVAQVTGVDEAQWSFDTEPLGAGSWGVVWPLTDERFILKVTADPTEGPIVATIMAEPHLHNHMAIIHYFALRRLPEDVVSRNKSFPLYVIVAERLAHSSGVSKLMLDPDHPDADRQYDANYRFTGALRDLQMSARALVKERSRKRPRAYMVDKLYAEWMDAVMKLNDSPMEDFIIQFYDHTRSDSEGHDDMPSGGVLADLHFNNVGKRVVDWTDLGIELSPSRHHEYWVISDPGHSSLAEKPEIDVLENPGRARRRFKPTERMAANARRALEVRANKPASQQGMTSVGLARARQLIRRQALSLSTVKRMASFFARHEVDKSGATWADKGKGWQAWMGWGGDAGRAWANAIVKSVARANPPSFKWGRIEGDPASDLITYRPQGTWDLVRSSASRRPATAPPTKEGWVLYCPVQVPGSVGSLDRSRLVLGEMSRDEAQARAEEIIRRAESKTNPARRGVPLSIGMCMPEIVAAAQRVYDDLDEDDEDLGGGGICDLIADEIVGVLSAAGFEAQTVLQSHGAQHVFTIAKVPEGVYTIDISPFVYEEGSMFSWEKIPDVVFDEDAVEVMQLSADPSKFDDYCY